jgi:hypothetical protein
VDNVSLTPFVPLGDVLHVLRGTLEIPGVDASDIGMLGEVARWTVDYLCESHPDLGRSGDVCPFTAVALREELLLSAVCHVYDADPRPSMRDVMLQTMRDFEAMSPQLGNRAGLKAMLVLFPSLEGMWVDDVQEDLSLTFAERGLMIGEFHAECQKVGLHNAYFLPLRSPIPLLAVRNMMLTDLAFLNASDTKLRLYLQRFGDAATNAITAYLKHPHAEIEESVLARLELALRGMLE